MGDYTDDGRTYHVGACENGFCKGCAQAPVRPVPTQREVYELAVNKGWHEQHARLTTFLIANHAHPDLIKHARATWLAARLALIHAEVSEALEEVRKGHGLHFGDELADVALRLKDLAEDTSVDLEQAQAEKHAFNATRTHRHGGKAL